MKINEIIRESEMIRGKYAKRAVDYDPNYKGLQNYKGKLLMNDADAIEALLYGRSFSQEEDAFRDLLIRKYKITKETDIGALVTKIRSELEQRNKKYVADFDASQADEDITVTEQEMDVISADDQQVTVKDQKTGIETKIPRDPNKPGIIQKDPKDPTGKKFIIDPSAKGEVDNEIKPGAKAMMKMPMV